MPKKSKPKCKTCDDTGYLMDNGGGFVPPSMIRCLCKRPYDLARNAERGWRGLSKIQSVKESPLSAYVQKNLWVTATPEFFGRHLKRVVLQQHVMWLFQVVSDAELMDAWLGGIQAKDIYDPDLQKIRGSVETYTGSNLAKVVEPPELLIIRTGVKVARNEAMPEVLHETLMRRSQHGNPTWIFDQPATPLQAGHRSYSPEAYEFIKHWGRLELERYVLQEEGTHFKPIVVGDAFPEDFAEKSIKEESEEDSSIAQLEADADQSHKKALNGGSQTVKSQVKNVKAVVIVESEVIGEEGDYEEELGDKEEGGGDTHELPELLNMGDDDPEPKSKWGKR